MDYLRYEIWPVLKVRLRYWWWILKYGGKKHIPREVVFESMAKSLERMNQNFANALRSMPVDSDEGERLAMREAMMKMAILQGKVGDMYQKGTAKHP